MKPLIAVAMIFFSVVVYAVPPLDLMGHNDAGENVTVIGDSMEESYSEILIRKNGKETFLKKQYCGHSGADIFSCSADGTSPLAGATFRFKKLKVAENPHTMDCGRVAVCEHGCGPRTPHELLESGYECNDVAVCPNLKLEKGSVSLISTSGAVSGDNVNLRDNPHTQSRILRTLTREVKVKVTDSTAACWLVNGKPGVWVFVTVIDNNTPKNGWLYDAYIDYQK
jgi:uncharacterized protein YgiM (DUF1202 family)